MINLSLAGVVARRRLGFWSALQRQVRLLTTSLTLCRSKKPFYNSSSEEELRHEDPRPESSRHPLWEGERR